MLRFCKKNDARNVFKKFCCAFCNVPKCLTSGYYHTGLYNSVSWTQLIVCWTTRNNKTPTSNKLLVPPWTSFPTIIPKFGNLISSKSGKFNRWIQGWKVGTLKWLLSIQLIDWFNLLLVFRLGRIDQKPLYWSISPPPNVSPFALRLTPGLGVKQNLCCGVCEWKRYVTKNQPWPAPSLNSCAAAPSGGPMRHYAQSSGQPCFHGDSRLACLILLC